MSDPIDHRRPPCPKCRTGVGLPRVVSTIPGREEVNLTMICASCQHKWTVKTTSE